jgi:uncharacterized protein (DUF1330 family)
MAAYIIVEVNVTDQALYDDYKKLVPPTLELYGGTFVVRGGETETLEGDWNPGRFVILQFESVERAKAWWASEEYRAPKQLRQRASSARMIVAEGV